MADSVRRVLSDEGQVGILTWVLLALMAYAAIATVFSLRRGPESSRLIMAWGSGITPALYGMAAALAGSPTSVMWLGVLLAVALVGWVAVTTRSM
jgi:hypothetical protein